MRVIIPSAGKGRRLGTRDGEPPKVLHRVCGRPLLEIVLSQVDFIPDEDIYIVVGYQKEKVMQAFGSRYHYVEQNEQLGTGHAVRMCEPWFRDYDGTVLVTFGDMPLFRREILKKICAFHEARQADCTLLTAENPALPYWARIVRDKAGRFSRIAEAKDCTPEEKNIRELFSGVLVFNSRSLFRFLPEIGNSNAQGEYYLTEVPELMARRGLRVETLMDDDGDDLRGVNTQEDLAWVEQVMRQRHMI
ncbi:MAG: NTP transferase domain-containing protein [Clostridia bacterium]|nr:NTP transferase domain-containing protein [Clostridia bacterium]